ncbi:peroxiredoxin [Deinococcus sp. QL22]|uniref:peroxiredoxin n=1 Tax=Deinococcus sp. QL22 TaxID=2939437 RepID=UPI002017582B|nr:peroxiredoxin [Deinococcus sp. QL22]UQN05406.1 peroxiredoxin [Deinococcus sp. QL22]
MTLQVGDVVPPFVASQDTGELYTAAPGRWRVFYFFPKTTTTHCQLQARRYQALYPEFEAMGIDIVGINGDPRKEQVEFRNLCKLSYPLIDDSSQNLTQLFGVMDEPWPGEDIRRPRRETFLVNPLGVIVQYWTEVNPGLDAETVLKASREWRA